jgi:RNA polymerase sigma-70 factor (ECF subfamily)
VAQSQGMSGVSEDWALVEALRAGDPLAFEQVFRHYYPALRTLAERRLGSRDEAEDAVQEAFERALKSFGGFGTHGEYQLGAWLSRIVTHVCYDHLSRRTRELNVAERVGVQPPGPDIADAVTDPPVMRQVSAAVADLPDAQRVAWVLRELVGLEYSDLAHQVGISEVNARARVSRAKTALQRRLYLLQGSLGGILLMPAAVVRVFLRRRNRWSNPVPGAGAGVYSSSAGAVYSTSPAVQLGVSQLASAPVVQSAVLSMGSLRGIVVGLAAAVAATTGTVAATTAAADGQSTVVVATARPIAKPTLVVDSATSPATVPPTSAPPVSTSPATVPPTSAPPVSTSSATPPPTSTTVAGHESETPPWLNLALTSPGAGTGPSPKGATASTVPSSATTVAPAPPPAATCPWTIPPVPAPPPQSTQVFSTVQTSPVDLSTVGNTPSFNIGTGLRPVAPDQPEISAFIQLQACTPPLAPGLSFTILDGDLTAVASGALVSTVGTADHPGYLYRGDVTPQGSKFPAGVTSFFAAQLTLDRPSNTAQLTLVFLTALLASPGPGTTTTTAPTTTASTTTPTITPATTAEALLNGVWSPPAGMSIWSTGEK